MRFIEKHPRIKFISLVIGYALASLLIISLVRYPGIVNKVAGLISAAEFEDHTPFQYRVLMPILIRTIDAVTPPAVKDYVDARLGSYIDQKFRNQRPDVATSKVDRLSKSGFRISLYLGLTYLFLVLFMLLLRKFALELNIFRESVCDILPLGMLIIMPTYFNWSLMYYDYPHLLLFTLGLYLMFKRRWVLFTLVYASGCLNKETMFFLPVIFAVFYFSKLPQRKFLALLGIQIILTLAVRGALYLAFKDNPGGVALYTLERNLNHLSLISSYFNFEVIGKGMLMPYYLNIPLPRGLNLTVLPVVMFFVIYGWKRKPEFIRKAAYYFPLLVVLAMFWGYIDEFRAYYDFLPIVYLLGLTGIKYFIVDHKPQEVRM